MKETAVIKDIMRLHLEPGICAGDHPVPIIEGAEDAAERIAAHFSQPSVIKILLDELTDEQRHDLFSSFCRHCGSKNTRCQCWNDE